MYKGTKTPIQEERDNINPKFYEIYHLETWACMCFSIRFIDRR